VFDKKIFIKMPVNEVDIQFIKSLKYSKWDKTRKIWHVTNYGTNLEKIKSHFGIRLKESELVKSEDVYSAWNNSVEIKIVRTLSGRLKIIGRYDKALNTRIKEFPYWQYDRMNKCFSIPYSERFLNSLKAILTNSGISFSYIEEERKGPREKRKKKEEIKNYRSCPDEYLFKLKELRYSENTVKNYVTMFTEFINYYSQKNIDEITENQIRDFLMYLNEKRQVSDSYLNIAINSIKFYYEKVRKGERRRYDLNRPKSGKKLPIYLTFEEMKKVIKLTDNPKHRAIIALFYGTGIRLSELVNCKLDDFDWGRRKLLIRNGKGKKERYVDIPKRFEGYYKEYVKHYRPAVYLFEGISGQKYSRRSVQQVVKQAARRAGINKVITPHKLRHTFASHQYELTKDIRWLQENLGHSSIRTTEIYTHLPGGTGEDKNPLDELDI